MKTNKIIFGALLGATVCSGAFAMSAEEQKAFCESHPDNYVWVEKNQECIPVNPCNSKDDHISGTYCANSGLGGCKHSRVSTEKYFQNVWNTSIEEEIDLGTEEVDGIGLSRNMTAYKTTDGNYLVLLQGVSHDTCTAADIAGDAFWAHGIGSVLYDSKVEAHVYNREGMERKELTESDCSEIADFATSIGDHLYHANFEGDRYDEVNRETITTCVLTWD